MTVWLGRSGLGEAPTSAIVRASRRISAGLRTREGYRGVFVVDAAATSPGMAEVGQELTDPVTGARLRFLATAGSTGGASVRMRIAVDSGWSAGPRHVHPRQTERMQVLAGSFEAQVGSWTRPLGPGDEIEVPPRTRHTISLVGDEGELEVEFEPALRTDEMFETMYSAGFPRRPPRFVPSAVRAIAESRGFRDEIRFLWPRRAAALLGVALAVVASSVRRR
jgi:quercetin dioxygenase-like cupin family protein